MGEKIEKESERESAPATDETEAWGCRRCWGRGMLAGVEVVWILMICTLSADGLEEEVQFDGCVCGCGTGGAALTGWNQPDGLEWEQ